MLAERTVAALQPLRAALLTAAGAEADACRSAAATEGVALLAKARLEGEALLTEARARGSSDGAIRVSAERARVQREARQIVLLAQHAAYDDLRRQAVAAVRALLEEPGERQRLAQALRDRLGSEVVVRDHPDGGLSGESADGRVVDASVGSLVDAALATVDLPSLWATT